MSTIKIKNERDWMNTHYQIRDVIIPTRYFFAPTNTSYNKNGKPNKRMLKFYNDRSGNQIGISYVGNVAIHEQFRGGEQNALITDNLKKWKKLSQIIRNNGTVPGIQLGCRYFDTRLFAESNMKNNPVKTIRKAISNLETEILETMSESFVRATGLAMKAGFNVVQLHGAHGFLLSLLLSETYNQRQDKYNAHDLTFLKDILKTIRENNPNIILDLRISVIESDDSKDHDIKMKHRLIQQLKDTSLDMISISNGMVFNEHKMIYPPRKWKNGWFVKEASKFAKTYPQFLWNICGNIKDPGEFDSIPSNLSLSFCRALIADPKFVKKNLKGKRKKINYCPGCNYCFTTRIKGDMKCKKRKL